MFDETVRTMRRDRAARRGVVDFLFRRTLEDMVDRAHMARRRFDRVLLAGCPSADLARLVRSAFPSVDIIEPSSAMAKAARATQQSDCRLNVPPGQYDLAMSLGGLADASDPLDLLMRLRLSVGDEGLVLGAFSGASTLPLMRSVMAKVDELRGHASPRVHPRIDPASLTSLLSKAGFSDPVVDIDRIVLRYSRFEDLVADLRGMASTNILTERSRNALLRKDLAAAHKAFDGARKADGKVGETVEVIHFSGWQVPR